MSHSTLQKLQKDIKRMVSNAVSFNKKGSEIVKGMGGDLSFPPQTDTAVRQVCGLPLHVKSAYE